MTRRYLNRAIKTELEAIRLKSKDGLLHWQAVVSAARRPSSVLHRYFDWNRERAMSVYLESQARELIASYTVVIETSGGEQHRTRGYVALTTDRESGGGYRSVLDVLSDRELKKQLLADAFADLQAFKQRYKKLAELAEIFRAVKKLGARMRRAA